MTLNREEITRVVAEEGAVVRVVVAQTKGSVPREVGAAMVVGAKGQTGTIGGGALEFEAVAEARRVLTGEDVQAFRMVPLGPAIGQCCGGAVGLFFERIDAGRLEQITEPAFARPVSPGTPCPMAVKRMLATARAGRGAPQAAMIDGWFIEPVASHGPVPLWVFGAGHVGRAIVNIMAPLPDFDITWVDTARDRFPAHIPNGVSPLIAGNPAEVVTYAPATAQHLILTYSHALDLELCHRLLSHGFAGAGLIGSATKWARFRNRLTALGHTSAQISRIRCPIGRPELGKHPQAIAVGVAEGLILTKQQKESVGSATG